MTLVFLAFAGFGLAAAAYEDARLEPVFACALFHFARLHWMPVDDAQFLGGVAVLFCLCALIDRKHASFHLASGFVVVGAVLLARDLLN